MADFSSLTVICSKLKANMSARYCVTTCKFACTNNTPCPDLVKANKSFPHHIEYVVEAHSTRLSDEFKLGFPIASKPLRAPELVPENKTMTTDPIHEDAQLAAQVAPVPSVAPSAPVKRRGGFEKGRKLGKRKPKVAPLTDVTPVILVAEPAKQIQPATSVAEPIDASPAMMSFVETAPGSDLYKIEPIHSLYDIMHLLENSKRHVVVAMNARKF